VRIKVILGRSSFGQILAGRDKRIGAKFKTTMFNETVFEAN
jgi:hypothetical protein